MIMMQLFTYVLITSLIGLIISNWQVMPKVFYNMILPDAENELFILKPRKRIHSLNQLKEAVFSFQYTPVEQSIAPSWSDVFN